MSNLKTSSPSHSWEGELEGEGGFEREAAGPPPFIPPPAAQEGGDAANPERGSALVYILIAIALLALLTMSFMNPSSQQTSSQNTFKLVSDLQSQIEFIRSSVQECVAMHVKGDNTIDNAAGGTDVGAARRYPIDPDSDHFLAATPGKAGNRQVRNIRCPGNPGDDDDHQPIFSASSGKFLPPPPDLFGEWQWYNGEDGVFFWTATDKTDAFIDAALTKLDEKFAPCEADIIDATGGAQVLDEASAVSCPAGSKCFRLWVISDTTRDVQGPESGLPDAAAAHYPTEAACDVP